MSSKIIEKNTQGLDTLIITDQYIVIAGHNSNDTKQCCESFLNKTDLTTYETAEKFFKELNNQYKNKDFKTNIMIYFLNIHTLWNYGNCHFMINDIEIKSNQKMKNLISELGILLKDNKQAFNAVMGNIRVFQKELENNSKTPYGYGVVNGKNIESDYVDNYVLPVNSLLIMATEGYDNLYYTLEETQVNNVNQCQNKTFVSVILKED